MTSIDLDPESEAFIRREIEAGRFREPAEVVRAGLAHLAEERRESQMIGRMLADAFADPRPSVPMDAVFDRLARKHAARSRT